MRTTSIWFALALAWMPAGSAFADDDDGYDAYTIRPGDIPATAPRFAQFPAKEWTGRNAQPLIVKAEDGLFRTRIREAAKDKPNFAGHYILARWGCGTDCVQLSIIDAITGQVFTDKQLATNVAVNVHPDLLDASSQWPSEGSLKFYVRSTMLMVIGAPNEDPARRGISYYAWNGTGLKLLRFVHKASRPDAGK